MAGQIATEDGQMIEEVRTELMSSVPNYPKYDMTDTEGRYAFADNALTQDYLVSGTKNDDYKNGISTVDLVRIQRHILGMEAFTSPYKMIAADVNNDKRINGVDLVELRKLILGIYTELPQNGSWKMVDASQTLSLDNPWIYNETRSIIDLSSDMMDEDFVGVKIGDVDNSVVVGLNNGPSVGRVLNLDFADGIVSEGELFEVTMSTTEELYGYQFTMDMSSVEFIDVSGLGVNGENIGIQSETMTMSHGSVTSLSGELFTLTLKARQAGQMSDLLGMNSKVTKAEAYIGESLELVKLGLGNGKGSGFSLGQNEPNPFSEATTISYTLPQSGEVRMTLYDVTGKVLRVINTEGVEGANNMLVDKEGLTAGVIYYKLEAGTHTATRHMIVIE